MGINIQFRWDWRSFGVACAWLTEEKQFGIQLTFLSIFFGRA